MASISIDQAAYFSGLSVKELEEYSGADGNKRDVSTADLKAARKMSYSAQREIEEAITKCEKNLETLKQVGALNFASTFSGSLLFGLDKEHASAVVDAVRASGDKALQHVVAKQLISEDLHRSRSSKGWDRQKNDEIARLLLSIDPQVVAEEAVDWDGGRHERYQLSQNYMDQLEKHVAGEGAMGARAKIVFGTLNHQSGDCADWLLRMSRVHQNIVTWGPFAWSPEQDSLWNMIEQLDKDNRLLPTLTVMSNPSYPNMERNWRKLVDALGDRDVDKKRLRDMIGRIMASGDLNAEEATRFRKFFLR